MSNDHKILPTSRKLTPRQEKFALAMVDGHGQSAAYKQAYSTANQSPESISSNAYKLAHEHTGIALRLEELRRDIGLAVVEARAWDRVRLIDEAVANLHLAREARQFGPANKAVEIIARLTGNLDGPEVSQDVRITKVTVVLTDTRSQGDPELDGADDGLTVDVGDYEVT